MTCVTGRLNDASSATGAAPLHRQVYHRVQNSIRQGKLGAGDRLPSTRALAAELGVSRNTVMAAFEQLIAEGYLEGHAGSGTFVAQGFATKGPSRTGVPSGIGLSRQGSAILAAGQSRITSNEPERPFEPGIPAIEPGLMRLWWRLMHTQWKQAGPSLSYQGSLGYPGLRKAIAVYLAVARGVRCEPDQVVITTGAQQGLDLAARLLTDPGDRVWMEDPGYLGAKAAFGAAGVTIVPVPVDRDGLVVSAGRARMPSARLAYVTPSHQFPTGTTMSLARRIDLLAWAREAGAWIIEDDYDSEFRYASRPLPALQGLDESGRVIYIGTFSKVMFPGMRIGYVVVPPNVVDAFAAARAVGDRQSPWLEQAALAEFLSEGHLGRHVRRMRSQYRERAGTLVDAIQRKLGGRLTAAMPDAGLHLTAWLRKGESDAYVCENARGAGVSAMALSRSAVLPCAPGLVLGFAGYPVTEIRGAVDRLASVIG